MAHLNCGPKLKDKALRIIIDTAIVTSSSTVKHTVRDRYFFQI